MYQLISRCQDIPNFVKIGHFIVAGHITSPHKYFRGVKWYQVDRIAE